MFFAQVELPAFLAGNGLVVAVGVVIAAIVAYRNKDAIKAKLGMNAADGTNFDPKADLVKFINDLETGVVSSPLVRGGSSLLCRKLIRVAQALPNADAAKKAHDQLRELFVEFGDPTPGETVDPIVSGK